MPTGGLGTDSPGLAALLEGWQLSGVFRAESGSPLNVTQSTSFPSSRPDLVSDDTVLADHREAGAYLDRAAFALVTIVPASGAGDRPGTLTRHALRGPGFWTVDAALAKSLRLSASHRLQIRADVFNVLNHPIYTSVVTSVNSSQFGRLTAATARTMQLSVRYTF